MRVADAIADWLHDKGITHAFGVIGGGNAVLFDAIQAQRKVAVCCSHHEQAAAMSSCYFNRVRGGLESVVLCTTGAGSTNAITGVMAAYMDSIPLLVLSGNEASKYMDARTRVWGTQGYPSSELASDFTIRSSRALDPKHVVHEIRLCMSLATNHGRQGPVWIDIPKDVQNAAI